MGFSLINHPAIGYHMANLISHTLPQISGTHTTPQPRWGLGDPILHPFGNGLYYHSTVMTGGLCKWQCEIPTAKNCGKVTGMEFWPAAKKSEQSLAWNGSSYYKSYYCIQTKITSEYLCSLFHQSLTQEKTTQTDIETNKSSGQAITPLITAGSVMRAISKGFWD